MFDLTISTGSDDQETANTVADALDQVVCQLRAGSVSGVVHVQGANVGRWLLDEN